MSSSDIYPTQTAAAEHAGAGVKETSTPEQQTVNASTYESTVTPLPRIEADAAPLAELPHADPLVVQAPAERINGRFALRNRDAWKHGLRSRRLSAVDASLVQDRISAIEADLGGPDELSTIARGQVKRHARLELAEDHLWRDLEEQGLSTGKGNTRARATLWLQVVDRLQKSSQTLGFNRKAKPVRSIEETLRERERA